MQARDDVGRQPRRTDEPEPRRIVDERMTGLGEGRHLGQARDALLGGDRERAQLAGLDVRQRRGQVIEEHLHLAGERVVERWAGAAIGHMGHVHLGGVLERFADQVAEAADAGRAEVELARVLSCVGDELGQGARRHGGMHRDDVGHGGDLAHEAEIGERVVAQVAVDDRIHDVRRDGGDAERVAVGRGIGDCLGADRTAGAAAVVDHESCP